MSIEISPKSFFEQPSVADMRLISCPGAEELTGLIDKHLVRWAKAAGIDKDTFIIPCDCPRFQSGDRLCGRYDICNLYDSDYECTGRKSERMD